MNSNNRLVTLSGLDRDAIAGALRNFIDLIDRDSDVPGRHTAAERAALAKIESPQPTPADLVGDDIEAARLTVDAVRQLLARVPVGRSGIARDWRMLAEDHLRDASESLVLALAMLRREESNA